MSPNLNHCYLQNKKNDQFTKHYYYAFAVQCLYVDQTNLYQLSFVNFSSLITRLQLSWFPQTEQLQLRSCDEILFFHIFIFQTCRIRISTTLEDIPAMIALFNDINGGHLRHYSF